MVNVALFVRLEVKPGKEKDVESFLRGGLQLVQQEPATTAWFAIKTWAIYIRHIRCLPQRVRSAGAPFRPGCRRFDGQGLRTLFEPAGN